MRNDAQTEAELKFELDPASAERLAQHPRLRRAKARAERLTSVYFDTDDLALRRAGLSLRVRHQNGKRVQTVKDGGAGTPLERREWEREIEANVPDPATLDGTPAAGLVGGGLRPLFETRVERTIRDLRGAGWAVEVSLDTAEIESGKRSERFVELELELKRGQSSHLFDLARRLGEAVPLRLTMRSKASRGFDLLDADAPPVAKALPVHLRGGDSTAQAFRAIGRECLRQLTANASVVLAARDPDAVHQTRVATRRLRAAMSIFGDIVRDDRVAFIKGEMKWIAAQLGEARNLDVFIRDVLTPLREQHPGDAGMADLHADFEDQRARAYGGALDALHSRRFAVAVLEAAAWLETGPWLTTEDELGRAKLDLPIETLARDELTRRRAKIRHMGQDLRSLAPDERHKLRIKIKKLRYASEFFAGLFTDRPKRRKRFLHALEALQGGLGALTDLAVDHGLETRFAEFGAHGPGERVQRPYAAGLVTGHRSARVEPALTQTMSAYDAFRSAKPFW